MDEYKESGNNYKQQFENSYTQLLFKKYEKHPDFRAVVNQFVETEKSHKGHCSAVQDAAKLADLISYNPKVKKVLYYKNKPVVG